MPTPTYLSDTVRPLLWFRLFVAAWLVVNGARIALASTLPLFGDEAFYWQESRQLALAYSDLPGLTAWMIALGNWVAGDTLLGVRLSFLLVAMAVPWCAAAIALRVLAPAQAWQMALLSLCLPLLMTLGVLALPDAPLTLLVLLSVWLWMRSVDSERISDWTLLGVVLMLGAWCHYRFALVWILGAVVLLMTASGRRLWWQPGLWLALFLAALGWLPLLLFNLQQEWSGAGFQLLERHPWSFSSRGLRQPLEQLLVLTPLIGVLLLMQIPELIRRARCSSPWQLLAWLSALHLLLYGGLGLFADQERMRVHWMMVGYIPLLMLLPGWASTKGRRFVLVLASALAALGGVVIMLALTLVATGSTLPSVWQQSRWYPDNFIGWQQIGERTATLLQHSEYPGGVIADNFMLAAQLQFETPLGVAPLVLDHPLNSKHGRARQLAIWQRDSQQLQHGAGEDVLLVVEDSASRGYDYLPWYQQICRQFDAMRRVDSVSFNDQRKRVSWFAARVRDAGSDGLSPGACPVPPFGYLDRPAQGEQVQGALIEFSGWAVAEALGVAEVRIRLDDGSEFVADYGLPAPQVLNAFPESSDPNHPDVGFRAQLRLPAGRHNAQVVVIANDGQRRDLAWQQFQVSEAAAD